MIGLVVYVAINGLAFVAIKRLPNDKWTAYLLTGYGILDAILMLMVGLRVFNAVWPIKSDDWDLISVMANADILYLKMEILVYLLIWAAIMILANLSPKADARKIQGN